MSRAISILLATFTVLFAADYRTAIEHWRAQHEAELKNENGWLSVSGLFWLKPGANPAGSDSSNAIVLPRGPAHAGVFDFRNNQVTFHTASGVPAEVNGKPGSANPLKSDADGAPDQLEMAGFTMTVIERSHRYGIRLRDPHSRTRTDFRGLHWFPVEEKYRVLAKFVPFDPPKTIPITNVLGQTEPEQTPGYVEFTLNNRQFRLEPVTEEHHLFFIFHDLTAGHQTYPAGRFLYADWPKNGLVELDFNKAENPPCAFTAFATCPLPPRQNYLDISIDAGEKNYDSH